MHYSFLKHKGSMEKIQDSREEDIRDVADLSFLVGAQQFLFLLIDL